MRNRFIAVVAGIAGLDLLALFLIYRVITHYMEQEALTSDAYALIVRNGLLVFAILFGVITIIAGIIIYRSIVIPMIAKQEDLKKAAEESYNAELIRKEFVANVSHELKTPLTSISGFIETLQQGAAEDPEIRTRFIDIIAIETSRLKRLIGDLLVLSDIENKRSTVDEKAFDVKTEIERTVETLELIAKEKDVNLIMHLENDLKIVGSADRFNQMMVNLIENAVKYSKAGGTVWIRSEIVQGRIQISVKDEGIGIAEEHLDRLFERFYRVDKSRSTKVGGTGLGLSIVKHIAALFNAKLKVESQVGEGSTFYVIFEREAVNGTSGFTNC